jgi:hypothetical protein
MIRITDILDEDLYKFMLLSRLVLLSVKTVSDKSCRKNQNTGFMCSNFFFFRKSCCLLHSVKKYSRAGQATDDSKIRRTHFTCGICNATSTNIKYVILIAYLRQ